MDGKIHGIQRNSKTKVKCFCVILRHIQGSGLLGRTAHESQQNKYDQ